MKERRLSPAIGPASVGASAFTGRGQKSSLHRGIDADLRSLTTPIFGDSGLAVGGEVEASRDFNVCHCTATYSFRCYAQHAHPI